MNIGYACINTIIGCTSSKTFRLASFSEDRLRATIADNLDCLGQILRFNRAHAITFFRLTSQLIPFASHPINTFPWQAVFKPTFIALEELIRENSMRVALHPSQFTILNSPSEDIFAASLRELEYHCDVLELLGVDSSHKIQLHVGGIYNDKAASIARFIQRYHQLPQRLRDRLVIENDDRLFTAQDCLAISERTGVPIVFDVLHHAILNEGEPMPAMLAATARTWQPSDGLPIVDYSDQDPIKRPGAHSQSINPDRFRQFLQVTHPFDFDIMLEVKDKEQSALQALAILQSLSSEHRKT